VVAPICNTGGRRSPDESTGDRSSHDRYWHKADMLNALTNVGFWGQSGHGPTAAYQSRYTAYPPAVCWFDCWYDGKILRKMGVFQPLLAERWDSNPQYGYPYPQD
jgi:hypothetical protein